MQQFSKKAILTYVFLYQLITIKLQCVHTAEMKTGFHFEKLKDVIDDIKSSLRFNYFNAHEWGNNYSECSGNRQSPINIDLSQIRQDDLGVNLTFHGYDAIPREMILFNNGVKVKLKAKWTKLAPSVTIGPCKYIFDSLHFHWGTDDSDGSEHSLNNASFPLEMHMLHYCDKYGNYEKAVNYTDGLSVIGVLFQIVDAKRSSVSPLARSVSLIKYQGNYTTVDPFPLSTFKFTTNHRYFIYNGSVTMPPCHESVLWILSTKILTVTEKEMELFRSVKLVNGEKLNHRPVQLLNNRKIIYIP